jgi:hypothetical protein
MEALSESIDEVNRGEAARPVIVVMHLGNEAPSSIRSGDVRSALRKSGATLHVIAPVGLGNVGADVYMAGSVPMLATISPVAAGVNEQGVAPNDANEERGDVRNVLDDGSKESGGRNVQATSVTLARVAFQLAGELLNQYEITYTLPAGVRPSDRLQVSSKRRNVSVVAPSRIRN